ncbi:Secreted protein [Pseudomonas sp. IT-P291]
MNLRAPLGVRLTASSLTFIASRLAPTGFHAGNKKPDINHRAELARQAGKTVWADLTLGIRQSVQLFPLVSPA